MSVPEKEGMEAIDPSEFAELVQRYKTSKHLDKLKISDEIWDRSISLDPEIRKKTQKKEWLATVLGLNGYDIEMREALRHAPETLISLVEEGLVMRSAALMFREAKDISLTTKVPIQVAIENVIATYKAGTRRYANDNTGWFWTKPTLAKAASGVAPKKAEESDTVKAHWSTIRSSLAQIALKKAGREIDPLVLEEANEWFEKELQRLIGNFTTKIRRNKKSEVVEVNRMQYASACKTLGIVPTEIGEEIDVEVAKAAKRSLVRRYHPDTGGEGHSEDKYKSVIEAFDTIELYADQMKKIAKNQSKANNKATRGD